MKLRIRGQSIRFRLSPEDIATLGRGEPVKEILIFGPDASFTYGLVPADVSSVSVDPGGTALLILCPRALVSNLVDTGDVGFEGELSAPNRPSVKVLVEKDFQCLIPRGEDDGMTFPNPNAAD